MCALMSSGVCCFCDCLPHPYSSTHHSTCLSTQRRFWRQRRRRWRSCGCCGSFAAGTGPRHRWSSTSLATSPPPTLATSSPTSRLFVAAPLPPTRPSAGHPCTSCRHWSVDVPLTYGAVFWGACLRACRQQRNADCWRGATVRCICGFVI